MKREEEENHEKIKVEEEIKEEGNDKQMKEGNNEKMKKKTI